MELKLLDPKPYLYIAGRDDHRIKELLEAQAKLTQKDTLRQVVEMFDKADAEVKDSEYAWMNESIAGRLRSVVEQLREASK